MYFSEVINSFKSNKMPTSIPEFTRYLYLKQDVKEAAIGAILNNDQDTAMFWVYELYFSGFESETIQLLWQCYYDFYAVLNPLTEKYMKKKETSIKNENDRMLFICLFVNNLLIRKHTTDVFMLKKVTHEIYPDEEESKLPVDVMIKDKHLEALCHHWCGLCDKERTKLVDIINTFFKGEKISLTIEKKNTNKHVNTKTIVITRIAQGYELIKKQQLDLKTKQKNLYVVPDVKLIDNNRTQEVNNELPYKFFKKVVKYSPDQYGMVSMSREDVSDTIIDIFRDGRKWLVSAHNTTPLWKDRVVKYGGSVSEDNTLIWQSDDHEEEFYEKYWFDTEEQPLSIQQLCIPRIKKNRSILRDFQECHNTQGMYNPCNEVLECLCE